MTRTRACAGTHEVETAVKPYDTAPDKKATDMPQRAPYTSISGPHSRPPTSCASEDSDCMSPYWRASAPKLRVRAGRRIRRAAL
jgi:hypothetical protein